ncbi:hypothetical protein WJX73_008845 [Symbiochloris irregularis]|uniref:F-box domain-containing protein n=1 Tax=Symbiochloris irregularis TaxID=706552 RepID=A0AAW1PCN3_9CHLO
MQCNTERSTRARPRWDALPSELLFRVHKHLSLIDQVRAETSCRSWYQAFCNSQDCKLWNPLQIKLDQLRCPKSTSPEQEYSWLSASQAFQPMCEWVQRHIGSIASLQIVTKGCNESCASDKCCAPSPNICQRVMSIVFAMLLAPLERQPVEVHVKLERHAEVWPLDRQPMLQQACAQHLVSLQLHNAVDSRELLSICGLTRLTLLQLNIDEEGLSEFPHAAAGLTSMHKLQSLTLKAESDQASLGGVDWSPLAQLTLLELGIKLGALSAAASVAGLQDLILQGSCDRLGPQALQQMQGLTCLSYICFQDMALLLDEVVMLQSLAGLQELSIWDLAANTFDTFPGGVATFCRALGRLTKLTYLNLKCAGNDGFDPVQLCHLSQLRRLFLVDLQIQDFDIPCTWERVEVLHLDDNELTQLPGNLSQLTALTELSLQNQNGEEAFQIASPMCFLTQLQNLLEVSLGQCSYHWNASSEFALMQARLSIKGTPGCRVQLLE